MKLNISTEHSFSEVDGFGVALSQPGTEQNHIAILFKFDDESDEVKLLHVGGHKTSLLDEPSSNYLWVDFGPDFNPIRKQVILASLQQIAEVNQDTLIRYGLDHGVYCFDSESGKLNDNYDYSIGFTCATFVIEVFLSFGVQLIDWDTWPPSKERNLDFQKKVLGYLASQHARAPSLVTLEYLESQQKNEGKARFLPQEVAAATQSIQPSTKEEVEPLASDIHKQLTQFTQSL
tara:strand:+ start:33009 stop:33707 length:699 start_codon:yes stop_codon:yes gene_type:complete